MKIESFKEKEYEFLSNFYLCDITYDGLEYPSTEHAYQAAKSFSPLEREYISKLKTCSESRKYGRKIENLREDWDEIRYGIMFQLLCQKFTRHIELGKKLIGTYPYELIEGNWWHDTYWGICKGVGQNVLGKQLMIIRDNLREISMAR